jgi:hypothetical protein
MIFFSEEIIARDIEEFEKQKHLQNTPAQVLLTFDSLEVGKISFPKHVIFLAFF